ncbi:L-threonylcarbamoyladenylate synthase [Methanospirillum stamsii]|nr:L-threonylcarbamoyladenylate synthase [Methanospirillum stamsii]
MHDGLIVYPTDTLYGLGADALSDEAILKVFEAKGREYHRPISIAVSDVEMMEAVAYIDEISQACIDEFLPGPVTIVLKARNILSPYLTAGTKKIGIRYPDHETALEIIKKYDSPITATSANISGGPEPLSIELCNVPYDFAVNAGQLPGTPSTVVDLVDGEIIRAGADIEKIAAFLAKWC